MIVRGILRLTLAAIFLAAAVPKILDPAAFATNIESYLILPDQLVNAVALVLPWMEFLLAALLVCRVWLDTALSLSALLLAVFLGAIASAHLRGIDLDCGCFGAAGGTTDDMRWYLVRDSLFLAVALAATWLHSRRDKDTADD